jgi:DNA-binding NarL/FixJ family response regulator
VRAGEDSNRLIDLLSPRAMQVAQLVARGLTNIEIGEQLGISPRTVATHLNACFDRLEVRTRSALARRVAEDAAREP